MSHRFVPALAGALLLSPLLEVQVVRAQCTRTTEASAVARSAAKRARCNYGALRVGPTTSCATIPAPPPCAGSLIDDAIALAYGPNNTAATTVDRRAVRSFPSRASSRAWGSTSTSRSRSPSWRASCRPCSRMAGASSASSTAAK